MPTPAENDVLQAHLNARNCVLLERSPGDAEVNVGSADERRMVSRSEALRQAYALYLLVELGADHGRLKAAARLCRQGAAKLPPHWPRHWLPDLPLAADLCERAARMVEDVGAVTDDKARRRLLAGCQREMHMSILGMFPSVAKAAADEYERAMREIDENP